MKNARTFAVALLLATSVVVTLLFSLPAVSAQGALGDADSATIEHDGRTITPPQGSHNIARGMAIWSSGSRGYLLTDSTGNESFTQALSPDQIAAIDLDTGLEVARTAVATIGVDQFHKHSASEQIAVDEENGKLYVPMAATTECASITVCVRRILVFDGTTLALERTITLGAAAGTLPQLDALSFSAPRFDGDRAKLYLLLSDMPAPGGGEKTLQDRSNIVRAVQIDAATGATDWAIQLNACTSTRSGAYDDVGNRSTVFRARSQPTTVYAGCYGSSLLGQVVRIDVNDANPLASVQNGFSGPRLVSRIFGDATSERVMFQAGGDGIGTVWVFDGTRRAFIGVAGLAPLSPPSIAVGFDEATGRLYALAAPTERTANAAPTPGGLMVIDTRRTPLPQATTFTEFADLPAIGSNVVPIAVRSARPDADRLVFFLAGRGSESPRAYEVLRDRMPISHDIPPDDPDRLTVDVDEAEGVTSSNFEGAVRGYGLRTLLVGGYGAIARSSGQDVSPLYEAKIGDTKLDLWGDCGRRDREVILGSTGPARASSETATAEARAVALDVSTAADLEQPTGRCTANPSGVSGPVFDAAACVSPDDDPAKVDPAAVQGPLPFMEADVACGATTAGHGVSQVAAIGPVTIGEASSSFSVYRDPVRGVVTRVESFTRNVDIGGQVQIDLVWAAAESWANGRKQPATVAADPNCDMTRSAGTCLRRSISGVVINGERHQGSPEDEAELVGAMQRALSREFVIRQRIPDPELAKGSPGGYVAGLQKPADEQFADAALNNDALLTLPALEVVRAVDGFGGRGRQVFQFAGVEISSTYGIELLPQEAPPAPGALEISLADGEGAALAGGIFKVFRDDDGDGAVGLLDEVIPDGTCVTAEDGVGSCRFDAIEPGPLVVQQVAGPTGYQLSPDLALAVGPGELARARFTNLRAVGAIELALTDDSDPAVPLPGAQFVVFGDDGDGIRSANDKEYAACTTDELGECRFDEVALGSYVVHQSSPASEHLAADDAAFELTSPGETARLVFVTGLTAIEETRGDEEVGVEDVAIPDEPTETTTVEIEEGPPIPLPTVETVANVTEAEEPRSLLRRVLQAPEELGRFLARHPREALLFAGVWALLLGACYLVVKRRKAAALIEAHAPRPLFGGVPYLTLPESSDGEPDGFVTVGRSTEETGP